MIENEIIGLIICGFIVIWTGVIFNRAYKSKIETIDTLRDERGKDD